MRVFDDRKDHQFQFLVFKYRLKEVSHAIVFDMYNISYIDC